MTHVSDEIVMCSHTKSRWNFILSLIYLAMLLLMLSSEVWELGWRSWSIWRTTLNVWVMLRRKCPLWSLKAIFYLSSQVRLLSSNICLLVFLPRYRYAFDLLHPANSVASQQCSYCVAIAVSLSFCSHSFIFTSMWKQHWISLSYLLYFPIFEIRP